MAALRFLRRKPGGEIVMPDLDDGSTTTSDMMSTLRQFEKVHHLDPNLPLEELNEIDSTISEANAEKGIEIEQMLIEENSPYPEVRASVRNFDVDLPVNTVRAWCIGMFLCTIGSAVNMLFSLRNPTISLTTVVIQLVAYPLGLGWDLIFPDRHFALFLGHKINLKPGPFNVKEHVLIVVMSNVRRVGRDGRQPPLHQDHSLCQTDGTL